MNCLRCDPTDPLHAEGLAPKVTIVGYPAAAGALMYASEADVVSLSDGFLQSRAFIDTGSSGGPVINATGDIVAVVSQGGGVGPGGVVELAKTRRVIFLRAAHEGLLLDPVLAVHVVHRCGLPAELLRRIASFLG